VSAGIDSEGTATDYWKAQSSPDEGKLSAHPLGISRGLSGSHYTDFDFICKFGTPHKESKRGLG